MRARSTGVRGDRPEARPRTDGDRAARARRRSQAGPEAARTAGKAARPPTASIPGTPAAGGLRRPSRRDDSPHGARKRDAAEIVTTNASVPRAEPWAEGRAERRSDDGRARARDRRLLEVSGSAFKKSVDSPTSTHPGTRSSTGRFANPFRPHPGDAGRVRRAHVPDRTSRPPRLSKDGNEERFGSLTRLTVVRSLPKA